MHNRKLVAIFRLAIAIGIGVGAGAVLGAAAGPAHAQAQPQPDMAALTGTWEWQGDALKVVLVLNADGTGKLTDDPIRYTIRDDILEIVVAGEAPLRYKYALQGNKLTISGGDLDAPTTFTKKGGRGIGGRVTPGSGTPGGAPAPQPQPGPGAPPPQNPLAPRNPLAPPTGGTAGAPAAAPALAGTWELRTPQGLATMVLNADGSGTFQGVPLKWTFNQGILSLGMNNQVTMYNCAPAGNALTLSGGDLQQPATFQRAGAAGGTSPANPLGNPGSGGGTAGGTAPAGGLAGTWELRTPQGLATMVLNADGSGTFQGVPLKWTFNQGILSLGMNNQVTMYNCALAGNALTLSGGDLQQPATFQRAGGGAGAGAGMGGGQPGGAVAGGGGIVGRWTGPDGTFEFRPDGSVVADGGISGRYAIKGDVLVITIEGETSSAPFRIDGNSLTITFEGEAETYQRAGGAGSQTTPPGPGGQQGGQAPGGAQGAAASGPMQQVAGVWMCQEASLDPQFYMSYTQYVVLYPDGNVSYAKVEGGASRTQVTEHLERFRYYNSGRQGGEKIVGRWETDGQRIAVQWQIWNGLLSRGEVDLSRGKISLSGMGVLQEGKTLVFDRQQ